MHYLLRLGEAGREAQEPRSRIRPDVLVVIAQRLPHVQTKDWVGRVLVTSAADVCDVLADLHSVISVSPCRVTDLTGLPALVDEVAREAMPGKQTFRVKVKRSGDHPFTSHAKAAELGARVLARFPELRVDLKAPEVLLGVEIWDDACYVYTDVVAGLDWRDQTLARPGAEPRFLVDQMLGRLLPWFRLLGFDTITVLDEADSLLQRVARAENRILLTKDFLLSRSQAVHVYFVQADDPLDQVQEVLRAYDIDIDRTRLFTRCTQCNELVERVDKHDFADKIPAEAFSHYDEFHYCRRCDKVYWKGAQYARIVDKLGDLLGEP